MNKPSTANIQRNAPTKQNTDMFKGSDSEEEKKDTTVTVKSGILQ